MYEGDKLNKLMNQIGNMDFDSLDNRASKDVDLSERGQGGKTEAANFTLSIRRSIFGGGFPLLSTAPLPFAIFGSSQAINGYRRLLNGIIPPTVTLVQVFRGEYNSYPESVVFVYSDAAGQEQIEVQCPQVPYPQLLEAAYTDNFKASKLRYTLSDATQVSQYTQPFAIYRTTMFGRQTNDTLDVATYRKPNDFQQGIVDLEGSINIDKEIAIVSAIIRTTTPNVPFGFNLSMFVEKYYRQTAQGL